MRNQNDDTVNRRKEMTDRIWEEGSRDYGDLSFCKFTFLDLQDLAYQDY